jgi:transcriptional regulator with XRE-family HTH domain
MSPTANTPTPQVAFGQLLRLWRRSRRLSQHDFGQLLQPKAHHSTVSCWESGARRPSMSFLPQILSLTGIPAFLAFEMLRTWKQPLDEAEVFAAVVAAAAAEEVAHGH